MHLPLFSTPSSDTRNATVIIPNLKSGFEFNIASVWLKPGASNLNYVILNKALPTQSPTWHEQELTPSFSPGFELGVRYILSGTPGQDINLDWTHLDTSTSDTTVADNAEYFLGPDFEIGPAGIPIRTATGNAKFDYNVINLDMGQYIGFGEHLTMRLFGGLSTGLLNEQTTATYSGTRAGTFAGPFSMTQKVYSDFTGAGPRAGLQVNYTADNGLGFMGEAAASALIGSINSTTTYKGSGQELLTTYGQTTNYQKITDQNVYQVVPGFDAKVGVTYKHAFARGELLTIAAGYQAAVFINAISQYLPQTLVSGQPLESGGIFVATMSHTLSNYSVQGSFLNFALAV